MIGTAIRKRMSTGSFAKCDALRRLASGARLRAEPLTLFLDGWERDVTSTVVDGAVIISRQGKRTHLRARGNYVTPGALAANTLDRFIIA
jgi:hypothetical protein